MRVRFSPSARESLKDAAEFVERVSPPAARRLRRRIIFRARQLVEFPESGRIVPEYGTKSVRELIEGPYRIWYSVRGDQVEILAIIHGSRQIEDR